MEVAMNKLKKLLLISIAFTFLNTCLQAMIKTEDENERETLFSSNLSSPTVSTHVSRGEHLDYEFINPFLRIIALQPRTTDFERLEFLGDRVLGLVTAHFLHKNYPLKNVEWLATVFEEMVSKSALAQMYKGLNIDPSELSSSCYQPPIYGLIAEKTTSDIIEALIGAVYKDGRFKAALTFTEQLINRHYNLTDKVEDALLTRPLLLPSSSRKSPYFKLLSSLEETISYHFKNDRLLYEAFHHPSAGGIVFKRLDFIGVRVLALVIAEKVFNDYPCDEEGLLTQTFAKTINNEILEEVFQKWQLWRYLKKQHNGTLSSLLAPERVPNRMAANTVRTLIGAVYLDGGFEAAQSITNKLFLTTPPEEFVKNFPPSLKEVFENMRNTKTFQSDNSQASNASSFPLRSESWPSLDKKEIITSTEELSDSNKKLASSINQNSPPYHSQSKLTYLQASTQKPIDSKIHKITPSKQEMWPALNNK